MSQNTAIRTTSRVWDFLEPAIDPNSARTIHGLIVPAATDTTVVYPMGQVLRQKDDGTNAWAKQGVAGYTGPARLLKYPVIVDDNGDWQYGATWQENGEIFENSMEMYYQGKFKCQDLVGLSGTGVGGVNEIQTETVTATGGTRTLTVTNPTTGVSATTAAIAYNANAATIQAALEALANVGVNDIVVTGTGPYVYTFSGADFAGQNIALIVVGTGSLTGGSSSIAESTAGASNIAEIGRLISGTILAGILELGGAPLASS